MKDNVKAGIELLLLWNQGLNYSSFGYLTGSLLVFAVLLFGEGRAVVVVVVVAAMLLLLP